MPAVSHRLRRETRARLTGWTPQQAALERAALRCSIRAARQAATGALLSISVPSWSPIRAWQNAMKAPLNRVRRQAESQLAAIEEVYPTPPAWKPRPSSPADKRIAKQYEAKHTHANARWCMTPEAYFTWRHARKHRRRDAAVRKREDAARSAAIRAKWATEQELAECGIVLNPPDLHELQFERELDELRAARIAACTSVAA